MKALILFLVQLASITVYLDLWMVIKMKRHLFEPMLGLISQKQRKVYQTIYRQSLIRTQFCVCDKVDVSGSTFNTVLLFLTGYSWLVSTFGHLYFRLHIHHLLWLNGIVWFMFMMFCMIGYRDPRELCFYCKFTMVAGASHFLLLCLVNEGEIPPLLFVIMLIIFVLVTVSAQSDRMERRSALKQKKKQLEAKKLLDEREREEKLGQVEIEIDCPGNSSRIF